MIENIFSRSLATMTLCLAATHGIAAEANLACAKESDDRKRLACYDQAFPPVAEAVSPSPANAREVTPQALNTADSGRATSIMSKFWELGAEDKRGTFVVKTYLPNFLLPFHYTSNVNRSPSSPTQASIPNNPNYRHIEAKMQISLRAKVVEDLFLPGADLWVAYTQRSMWQVWDHADSAPFRSTDYQPEAIYVIPVPAGIGKLPLGWNLRMLQAGIAHQSNGQSDPYSRSWNRVYVGAGFEHSDFGLNLRLNGRLPEPDSDQNPDLVSYVGRGEIMMNWFPGLYTASMTWRTNLTSLDRGSLQIDLTHPVFADQPAGLRWYAQLFSGYGETLLDYNHRQTRIGLGLSLFQF